MGYPYPSNIEVSSDWDPQGADFVMRETRRGLDKIETIECSAPQLSQVQ